MQSSASSINRLFLLRHAHSAWPRPGEKDFDRQLDETGEAEAARIAHLAREHGLRPDRIVTSSARRCLQTAALFVSETESKAGIKEDIALYTEGVDYYLSLGATEGAQGAMMIVGHNPMIEESFIRLARSDMADRLIAAGFPTAGLAAFEKAADGTWRLQTLLTP